MLRFVKKHWICSIFILLIIFLFVYIKFWFDLSPLARFRPFSEEELQERQLHFRTHWEPFDISTVNTKRINYHNHSGKYYHCFELGFEDRTLYEKVKDFDEKYRIYSYDGYPPGGDDAAFNLSKKNKPHLRIAIYRNNILLMKQDIYMMNMSNPSYVLGDNDQQIELKVLRGYFKLRELACYHFKDDTDYEIEISNLVPFSEYKGIQTFFKIETRMRY